MNIEITKVHNQATLNEYDLFSSSSGDYLKYAFLVKPGIIELFYKDEEIINSLDEIYIGEINYNSKEEVSKKFKIHNLINPKISQQGKKLIIEVDNYNDNLNYAISFKSETIYVKLDPSIGGIIDTHYNAFEEKNFGVRLINGNALFKVWSPPASKIEIFLYDQFNNYIATSKPLIMKKGEKGVWTFELSASEIAFFNLYDLLYQYKVYAYGNEYIALDPYAFSMGNFNPKNSDKIGKAAIVDLSSVQSKPLNFTKTLNNSNILKDENDLIAYETHVRDFTIQPGVVQNEKAGTYIGFTEKIDYLKSLGITHVQLMPIMKFYTVNEKDKSFSDKSSTNINYNWGYDPMNFFTPEGWYSSNPECPYTRVKELRTLIQYLHNNNIGVILDVVYNHTHIVETFENIAPGCYYRLNENMKISGHTGAGPSIESRRPMVRKLIIDSLIHFIKEYHVDGFRFDLMSFMDHDTISMIREIVGHEYNPNDKNSLILQGEAWVFSDLDTTSDSQGVNSAITKINYPNDNSLGIFNDTSRDAIIGNAHEKGFIFNPNYSLPKLYSVILGGIKNYKPILKNLINNNYHNNYCFFAEKTSNCLNFLTVHDGFTLWDKINLILKEEDFNKKMHFLRFASLVLFASQGKIFIHGGDEFLRSKPKADNDPEPSRTHTSTGIIEEEGVSSFHENSYCSPDFTNMVRWDKLEKNVEAKNLSEYYSGLILLRRSLSAFRLKSTDDIKNRIKFITDANTNEYPFYGFDDESLATITIEFENGPPREKYFIAGEIHGDIDDNPIINPFYVHLDSHGKAQIKFDRKQINNFQLNKWANGGVLAFKLVRKPGEWETIEYAYSPSGNNSFSASALNKEGKIKIDLSQKDHSLNPKLEYAKHIAFIIDNEISGETQEMYSKILVVFNPTEKQIELKIDEIDITWNWVVIADLYNSGLDPIVFSEKNNNEKGTTPIFITKGLVIIPPHFGGIIGKRNDN